jgi:hypothetical protein
MNKNIIIMRWRFELKPKLKLDLKIEKKERNTIKKQNEIYKNINPTILVWLKSTFNLSTKLTFIFELQIGNWK